MLKASQGYGSIMMKRRRAYCLRQKSEKSARRETTVQVGAGRNLKTERHSGAYNPEGVPADELGTPLPISKAGGGPSDLVAGSLLPTCPFW
jgi:hypothetical protein